ncbi:MAG TPA: hypothetical protein DEO49_03570 [Sutterella sp.]|nr:hypothetical protein [Sutterella sp.]
MTKIPRWANDYLCKGLGFQRAALLVGARQSGKTTMVREQCPLNSRYMTLDDEIALLAARNDPRFFVRQAYVWPLRIPQFGHEKGPPRWGILLASKKPFIPVNMLAASRGSSASLQTT